VGIPLIELRGTSPSQNGFFLGPGGNTVRGLVINSFGQHGFFITNTSTNNIIEGNFIGTDLTGNIAHGNLGDGIFMESTRNNTIGGTTAAARNVISDSRG